MCTSIRFALLLLVGVVILVPPAVAVETPVKGKEILILSGFVDLLTFHSLDSRISAPFPDPRLGSALIVGSSSASGQCRTEIALDPDKWVPVAGDGTHKGYRYFDASEDGLLFVRIGKDQLRVLGLGEITSCDLSATSQNLPLTVELRVESDRFCSAFGGTIRKNQEGFFKARNAPRPDACIDADVTVANLNILHGFGCDPLRPNDGDQCRVEDRIDLLVQHLVAIGCPDIVTLQENVVNEFVQVGPTEEVGRSLQPSSSSRSGLTISRRPVASPTRWFSIPRARTVAGAPRGIDEELILTRYPALASEVTTLYSALSPVFARQVLYARIDHPVGPVDVFTSHLASGSDAGSLPCGIDLMLFPGFEPPPCPAECEVVRTVRACQARQLALLVEARHDVPTPAVITGDFNTEPETDAYNEFAGRGWIDTYLAAGNRECNPDTGVGCTSGREDEALDELESPLANVDERIDYTFLVPPGEGSICKAMLDPAEDLDGDGGGTRIFADDPNPFAMSCGASPLAICWPSDHEGTELDLNCAD